MTERENPIAPGWGSDLKVAAVAAMTPVLCGLLLLLGWMWIGGFGILLGLGGAVWWATWWFGRNSKSFFPDHADTGAFTVTACLTALVLILTLVSI